MSVHVKLLLLRINWPDDDVMYMIWPLGAEELSTVTPSKIAIVKLLLDKTPPVEFKADMSVKVQSVTVKVRVLSSMKNTPASP